MIIEYFQPNTVKEKTIIEITEIGYAYRDCEVNIMDIGTKSNDFGASGSCNVNVNCSEGNNYRKAQRGVGRILLRGESFTAWCSGSLINNANRDLQPYFLSAAHCVQDITVPEYYNQFVFYFNYESSGCVATSEPSSRTLVGTIVKAKGVASDFLLLKLKNDVPDYFNAYWNGWNINNLASSKGVAIHHPAGDIKKISTYTTPLQSASYGGGYSQTHWRARWVATANGNGITEGGSSGCPIFDTASRIRGVLTGGTSDCNAAIADRNDLFGKISYAWTSNGTTEQKQLKPWLDPNNTGITELRGDDYTTLSLPIFDKIEENFSIIYPNPAKNNIIIRLTPQNSETNISFFDEKSRELKHILIPQKTKEYNIDIKDLPQGIYILNFKSKENTWTNKLIVK